MESQEEGGRLLVTAREGSDAWRETYYGFVHDDEHALLTDWARDEAVEVSFTARFEAQFDQAGILVRASDRHWVKTGVEFSDGAPQLGAVVTDGRSDWSVAPVPEWLDREVTLRVSRVRDSLIIRARVDDDAPRLVRVVPMDVDLPLQAGPYCCSPTRSGLTVEFHEWRLTEPDGGLH